MPPIPQLQIFFLDQSQSRTSLEFIRSNSQLGLPGQLHDSLPEATVRVHDGGRGSDSHHREVSIAKRDIMSSGVEARRSGTDTQSNC
jgi:hypothetical protein